VEEVFSLSFSFSTRICQPAQAESLLPGHQRSKFVHKISLQSADVDWIMLCSCINLKRAFLSIKTLSISPLSITSHIPTVIINTEFLPTNSHTFLIQALWKETNWSPIVNEIHPANSTDWGKTIIENSVSLFIKPLTQHLQTKHPPFNTFCLQFYTCWQPVDFFCSSYWQ